MAKFLMLGKYSVEAIKGITAERTNKVIGTIERSGGKINFMYALLGAYDLAFMVDFPGIQEVMKSSIELTKSTDIAFTTFPAIIVEDFDKITG
ncbi:MAG: GYD domain-containing protein [Candidatus Omnitrophota bacterium]